VATGLGLEQWLSLVESTAQYLHLNAIMQQHIPGPVYLRVQENSAGGVAEIATRAAVMSPW
jgi:hypothetical protein